MSSTIVKALAFIAAASYVCLADTIQLTDLCSGPTNPVRVDLIDSGKFLEVWQELGPNYFQIHENINNTGCIAFQFDSGILNTTYKLGAEPFISRFGEAVDLGYYTDYSHQRCGLDDAFDPRPEKIQMPFLFTSCPNISYGDTGFVEPWLKKQASIYDTASTPEKQWTAYSYQPLGLDISNQRIPSDEFFDAVSEATGQRDNPQMSERNVVERGDAFFSMVEKNSYIDEKKIQNFTRALSKRMSLPKSAGCARIYTYDNKLGYTFAYGLDKEAVLGAKCTQFDATKVIYVWNPPVVAKVPPSPFPRKKSSYLDLKYLDWRLLVNIMGLVLNTISLYLNRGLWYVKVSILVYFLAFLWGLHQALK